MQTPSSADGDSLCDRSTDSAGVAQQQVLEASSLAIKIQGARQPAKSLAVLQFSLLVFAFWPRSRMQLLNVARWAGQAGQAGSVVIPFGSSGVQDQSERLSLIDPFSLVFQERLEHS